MVNDDPKFHALLREIRELTSVANDRLLEIGAVACGPEGTHDPKDLLAQPHTRCLFIVMEHHWDGDPSDPGNAYIIGTATDIEDARRQLFLGEEDRHPDRRWRMVDWQREELFIESIEEEGGEERNIRFNEDVDRIARDRAEEFEWVDFDHDWQESGGSKRWIETVTLP